MRDINVTIEVGKTFVYVMVYQGTRSPHVPGGMRVLRKFYLECPDPATICSAPAVLELVGRELAGSYGVAAWEQEPLF